MYNLLVSLLSKIALSLEKLSVFARFKYALKYNSAVFLLEYSWHPAFDNAWSRSLKCLSIVCTKRVLDYTLKSASTSTFSCKCYFLLNNRYPLVSISSKISNSSIAIVQIENPYVIGNCIDTYSSRNFDTWEQSLVEIDKLGAPQINYIAISSGCRDLCKSYPLIYGEQASRVKVVPPSVTPQTTHRFIEAKFNSPSSSLRVLGISTKWWGKGSPLFIAVARMCPELKFTLLYSADPDDSPACDAFSSLPSNLEIIHKQSKMSPYYKRRLFCSHDVFFHPLLQDAVGVYMDCMAYGLPVVSTLLYDKAEFISHGNDGYLHIPPYDMWSEILGGRLSSYSEFVSQCSRIHLQGQFDDFVASCSESLLMLDDDRPRLESMSLSILKRCLIGKNSNAFRASQIANLLNEIELQ